MNDSNYTLRFPRTSREAFGHQAVFHYSNHDKIVGIAIALLAAFISGLIAGYAL